MIADNRNKAYFKLLLGVFLIIFARSIVHTVPGVFVLVLAVGSLVSWYWGCGVYAASKGYSPVLAITGIIGLFGLLILFSLPDKHKMMPNTAVNAAS